MKVIAFALAGFAFTDWLQLLVVLAASGYCGTLMGTRFLHATPESLFRLVFSMILTLSALDIIRRGIVEWLA